MAGASRVCGRSGKTVGTVRGVPIIHRLKEQILAQHPRRPPQAILETASVASAHESCRMMMIRSSCFARLIFLPKFS